VSQPPSDPEGVARSRMVLTCSSRPPVRRPRQQAAVVLGEVSVVLHDTARAVSTCDADLRQPLRTAR